MKKLAICLKTFLDEEDLDRFLNDELKNITDIGVFRKGQQYMVVEKYYDKNYFKLVEEISCEMEK